MSTINLPVYAISSRKMLEDLETRRLQTLEITKQTLAQCIESAIVPKIVEKFPNLKEIKHEVSVDDNLCPTIFFMSPAFQAFAVLFDREEVTILGHVTLESFSIPNHELEEIP